MGYRFKFRGAESIVNTITAGAQSQSRVVVLTDGSFVIVWTDQSGQSGDADAAIKAQRYDASGAKVGSEFRVNTIVANNQSAPAATALSNGGFVITWTDQSGQGGDPNNSVKAQIYAANGSPVGGEFLVNTVTTNAQQSSVTAALANGRFVIAWQDSSLIGGDNSGSGIRAQIFNADGSKSGADFLVNTVIAGNQTLPSIASTGNGGFALVWGAGRVQFFDDQGAKIGSEQTVVVGTPPAVLGVPRVFSVGSNLLVLWNERAVANDTNANDVKGQLFSAAGVKIGGVLSINVPTAGDQTQAEAVALPGGGFMVTWVSVSAADATDFNVFAQAFDANGLRVGTEFQVSQGRGTTPKIAALPTGEVILTFADTVSLGPDGVTSQDIRMQVLVASADAPTDITLSSAVVSETAFGTSEIGRLGGVGALGETYTYQLVSDSTGGGFAINGDRLVVGDNRRLDFETAPNAQIRVRVTDASGYSYEETLTINIADAAIEARYAAGSVFRTHTDTAGFNTAAGVIALAGGGFVVINNFLNPGSADTDGARLQIYDANGNPVGSERTLDVSGTNVSSGAAALADGGFVAAFSVAGRERIQRFDATGNEVGAEFLLDPSNAITSRASVIGLAQGGFVVAWERSVSGTDGASDVVAQRFDAFGNRVGAEIDVAATKTGEQRAPEIIARPEGGFAIFWLDLGGNAIRGRYYDAAGLPLGGERTIVADASDVGSQLDATTLANGNVVLSWTEIVGDASGLDAVAVGFQIVGSDGTNISDPIIVDVIAYDGFPGVDLKAIPGGGFVLTYSGVNPAGTSAADTLSWGQFFTADGQRVGDRFVIANDPAGGEGTAEVAVLASGDLVFGWSLNFLENGFYTSDSYARLVRPQESFTPTAGDDVLNGTNGNDVLRSLGGNDTLYGLGGDDTLDGGIGADRAFGGDGNDFFRFEAGGDDAGFGGNGDDAFYFGGAYTAGDSVDGGAGTLDQIGLQGDYAAGVTLDAMTGVEMIVLLPGSDARFGDTSGSLYNYTLAAPDSAIGAGKTLTIQANTLRAGENFTLDGSTETDGNFLTYGGFGVETLTGGAGNDGFFFGQGRFGAADSVNGGAGTLDQLGLQGNFTGAGRVVFGATQLSNLEFIVLLSATDNRFGAAGGTAAYDLTMNDGNVAAGQRMIIQANTLKAGETLAFNGQAETNGSFQIFSGLGDDILAGSQGADDIRANGGADRITGHGGADMLRGGAGDDVFAYRLASDSAAGARDQILDFAVGDLIDLAGLVSNTGGAGYSFIGGAGQNGARQVQVIQNGNAATVNVYIDGDAVADLVIDVTVADGHALTSNDFSGLEANIIQVGIGDMMAAKYGFEPSLRRFEADQVDLFAEPDPYEVVHIVANDFGM